MRFLFPALLLPICALAQSSADKRPHETDAPVLSPAEAQGKFQLADGLAIDLVLSEPLITQPLHISFDSRGRLWLVEARQYPKPAGLKEVSKDAVWRAIYDKVPPPPPHAEGSPFRGVDRISIHEDADGDGVYEKHKVFHDHLNMATSVAHTEHGVWVTHAPYLLFFPDKNQDDVPDGPPEVHLSGFGLEDTHSIANSLRWGPDGWLYGAQGSTVSAAVLAPAAPGSGDWRPWSPNFNPAPPPTGDQWPQVESDVRKLDSKTVKTMGQNIWRYHPEMRKYEIFAEGGGNAYGLEIDSKGRIFSGHNGGDTRGFHYVQGGYYQKGWEKHGELSNPYAFGYFPPMKHDKVERFTHQFIIYESDALEEKWRGKLWGCDVLHHNIVCAEMIPDGSTFKTKDIGRPVASTDKWFRPVMITDGPDGCLYIADWCDKQVSHYRNQMGVMDKEHGRVWRVRPAREPNPKRTLPSQNVASPIPDNRWLRQSYVRLAWERKWEWEIMKAFQESHDLYAAWTGFARGSIAPSYLCDDGDGHVAASALGVALSYADYTGEIGTRVPDKELARLAYGWKDPSVVIAALNYSRQLSAHPVDVVIAAAANPYVDKSDPLLPLYIWWTLETAVKRRPAEVLGRWLEESWLWKEQVVKSTLLDRLMKRFAITGKHDDYLRCAQLLKAAPDDESRQLLMKGFTAAMKGRSLAGLPQELLEQLAKTGGPLALALRVRQGDAAALKETLAILADGKHPQSNPDSRATLCAVFADKEEPAAVPVLLNLLAEAPLRRTTLAALQRQTAPDIATRVLKELPAWPAADKDAALTLLASRASWALALAKSGTDLPLAVVKKLQLFPDKELAVLIEQKYGDKLRAAGGEKEKEIQRVKSVLAATEGVPKKGQPIFEQRCAACHTLWNKGGKAGPDLTSYQRTDLDMLLLAIIAPSAEIREGFATTIIETKDGATLAGFISDQAGDTLALRDAAGQTHTLSKDRIAKQTPLPGSLMPEGLLAALTDEELRDFLAYIRSTTPPF